ncbi:conserved Plasmodium protein, unknown function [Plasmodium relictum]|uniref:RRM domain-containing protein n=1 Tax=Plasmodium relictum TaxID=85471 RepID=A0A1J1HAW7_PLARL|nr:conserved Plasmodium protein, unknown function [Plasmodium relictum]CRH02423.1 conserved Plasmodium protein, unknown function [Plasmodium relictum]
MNYSELDEDDEDLYEGLEAENLDSYEKKVEEKKKEIDKVIKPKEQSYEKSRNNLYKKLSGAKTIYTKKESCLFFGAPQASEDIEVGDHKTEFLLLLNLLYFINDILIKSICEKIGKVKRVLILEDEHYCKSLGMCLVEFYYLDNSQNYTAYLKEKLKVEVKKLDYNLEEQIKKDEIYNYGGYLDNNIIDQIKKENLENLHNMENFNDILNKSLNLNKHPLFTWFNTSLKDVLNTYVKSEIKKKKKCSISNDYIDKQNESNSDSGSDISTHILNYVSKKNKLCAFNNT